ncbi:hypothetical protein SKAU_G00207740 [Synaphobranchus kaupii]|uniref:Uncharacterized protein n=1 Tax=Synaphobranchus kaupii TaxID=118154 RepID=A0A9Q1ITQ8_SYNKA|nr:hypothetical protein SKAU_G00207740 [Synaphobranchus kaupii]
MESLDGKTKATLPTLLECNNLPDDRSEIPTPEVTQYFPHLKPVADKIPPLNTSAPILLLLGRDILSLHKVREQHNGPHNSPYAQRLDHGWVIVGEICLGGADKTEDVNVFKTHVLQNGRPSFLKPCTNSIHVKERLNGPAQHNLLTPSHSLEIFPDTSLDGLGKSVFQKTPEDDKPALSVDYSDFLRIMEKEVYMDDENHWVAPLPFRSPRKPLPNNREQALQRLSSLQRSFRRRPDMKEHFFDFMQKVIDNHQAEPAPQLQPGQECCPSPSVATYGLRKAAELGETEYGTDVKGFIFRNFYVDDGLASVSKEVEAIDLLQRTKDLLAESNLWLNKIASNSMQLAPYPMHTIPRLELCTAVLAVELAELIQSEIDLELHAVRFFTDSRIVLGYIHNSSRRFFTYVANRVARIRSSTEAKQWSYVTTDENPAD